MILKGKNAIPSRMTSSSVTSSSTNLTWTDLGLKPGLSGESPATDCLSNDATVLKTKINLKCLNNQPLTRCLHTPPPFLKALSLFTVKKIALLFWNYTELTKANCRQKARFFFFLMFNLAAYEVLTGL